MFEYSDLLKREKEAGDRPKLERISEERTVVRLLPPRAPEDSGFRDIGFHFNLGGEGRERRVCPAVSGQGPCPICEQVSASPDLRSRYGVRRQYLLPVIIRGRDAEGPRVLQVPRQVYLGILELLGDSEEPLPLMDVDDGLDAVIKKSGTGLNTAYSVQPRTVRSPLGEPDQIDRWLKERPDLDEVIGKLLEPAEQLEDLIPQTAVETTE